MQRPDYRSDKAAVNIAVYKRKLDISQLAKNTSRDFHLNYASVSITHFTCFLLFSSSITLLCEEKGKASTVGLSGRLSRLSPGLHHHMMLPECGWEFAL